MGLSRYKQHPGTGALQREGAIKVHQPLSACLLDGDARLWNFFVWGWRPLCNELYQNSTLDRRGAFKLQTKARQLQGPFHNPSGRVWVMQYPLQLEAGDDGDLVCLEVMTQLPRGNKEAEEQFLHTGVPRLSPLQEGADKLNWVLHHLLLLHHFT